MRALDEVAKLEAIHHFKKKSHQYCTFACSLNRASQKTSAQVPNEQWSGYPQSIFHLAHLKLGRAGMDLCVCFWLVFHTVRGSTHSVTQETTDTSATRSWSCRMEGQVEVRYKDAPGLLPKLDVK